MNYRHSYHAGNFADVFKHIVLVALIQSLKRKPNPFIFMDTHAGSGLYDLKSAEGQKSQEFSTGIDKLIKTSNTPSLIQTYLNTVKQLNTNGDLRYYPGSPAVAKCLLRSEDRMVLTELHETEYKNLKTHLRGDKIEIHHMDAYQALKAYLPPKERRGLVLIDPPYEKPDELGSLSKVLNNAVIKWATGVYAVWYPIKLQKPIERFHQSVAYNLKKDMLAIDLCIYPENTPNHLNGCGMLIVNPPWKLKEELQAVMPWLWQTLSPQQQGKYYLKEFLVG